MSLSGEDLKKFINRTTQDVDDIDGKRLSRMVGNIDDIHGLKKAQVKQVNNVLVDKANQSRKCQILKDNSRMLQIYDRMTHFIKLNQTTVMPAFHIRNKLSNNFNNWLVIGRDVFDKDLQKCSFLAMRHQGDMEKLAGLTCEIDGVAMKWSDLYYLAKQYGVINEGFFARELGVGTQTKGLFKKFLRPKLDPTDTKNFIAYKAGASVGGMVENQDRLLHFVAQLRNGKTAREATESVNKTLFDYGDLTAFEQDVMKRIIPYYTWLRKNGQLQLEMMLENPKKFQYVDKFFGGIEGMVPDEDRMDNEYINDFALNWIQLPFKVKNPQGREEHVMLNPNLPFMDLDRIPNPFSITDSVKSLFSQSNPILKVPIEQAMNKNVFFDSPIVQEGESQVINRLDHVFSNLAPYTSIKKLCY